MRDNDKFRQLLAVTGVLLGTYALIKIHHISQVTIELVQTNKELIDLYEKFAFDVRFADIVENYDNPGES